MSRIFQRIKEAVGMRAEPEPAPYSLPDDSILFLEPMDWLTLRGKHYEREMAIERRLRRALRRARKQRPITVQRYGGRHV